jgi:hypothetical protein
MPKGNRGFLEYLVNGEALTGKSLEKPVPSPGAVRIYAVRKMPL